MMQIQYLQLFNLCPTQSQVEESDVWSPYIKGLWKIRILANSARCTTTGADQMKQNKINEYGETLELNFL